MNLLSVNGNSLLTWLLQCILHNSHITMNTATQAYEFKLRQTLHLKSSIAWSTWDIRALGSGGAGGAAAPPEKKSGVRTPWKISWTPKRLEILVKRQYRCENGCSTCPPPPFFSCQRGWWCTIDDWYPYSVSRKSFLYALKCNFDTFIFWKIPYHGRGIPRPTPSPRSVASLPRQGRRYAW